jgi:AcrR family transcriptional regulator
VARTTFYAHYRNFDDVLLEVEDGLLEGLADVTERASGGDLPNMAFAAFLDETFGFIKERWRDFHALLVDQPDARLRRQVEGGR